MDMAADLIGPARRREQASGPPAAPLLALAQLAGAATERLVGAIGRIERGVEARADLDIALRRRARCHARPGAGRVRRGAGCPLLRPHGAHLPRSAPIGLVGAIRRAERM